MRSSNHKIVEVTHPDYDGVITVKGVTYYPYCRASEIDPPEDAWVEWDEICFEGRDHNVADLLSARAIEFIEGRVMEAIEG